MAKQATLADQRDAVIHVRVPLNTYEDFLVKVRKAGLKMPDAVRLLLKAYVDGLVQLGAISTNDNSLEGMLK